MRVTVTGGAGYIGSVVAEVLLDEGHQVLVLDNLSKGHRDAVPDSAIFAQCDIGNRHRTAALLRDFGADAVIHMAASSLVGESMRYPAGYYANNLVNGLALLDAMHDASVTRLVFSSTAAVYGEPLNSPIDEEAPTRPINPYGASKLAFESVLPWYAAAYGLRSTSLRYFNAAGATARRGERHQPETHLIPLVLDVAAGRRAAVEVYGTDYATPDGTCIRDYIHVRDLADAHILALAAMDGDATYRFYNLGCGGDGYSVRQVIDCAQRVTSQSIAVSVAPRRAGDPPVLVASSARITRELGWIPRRARLDEIIGSAWRWMKNGWHGD